jgi:hypothetical protein
MFEPRVDVIRLGLFGESKRSSEMGEACRLYPEGVVAGTRDWLAVRRLVASLATFALALAAMMKHELWARAHEQPQALLQVSRLCSWWSVEAVHAFMLSQTLHD